MSLPAPPATHRYGLDIETDTTVDGLDATCSAIVAVAVSTVAGDRVLTGDERQILRSLDALHLAAAIRLGVDAVVTYDTRMTQAARDLGLVVLAPA